MVERRNMVVESQVERRTNMMMSVCSLVAPGVSQAGRTALAPAVWVGGSGQPVGTLYLSTTTTTLAALREL